MPVQGLSSLRYTQAHGERQPLHPSQKKQRDSVTLQSLNKYKDTNHSQPWLWQAHACKLGELPRCHMLLQG